MAETLIDALEKAATVSDQGFTFLDNDLNPKVWSFFELHQEARRRGARLQALGLKKGDRVAMIVPEGQDFVLTFLGAITAGIVPVPMYPPLALGRLDSYIESSASIIEAAGARIVITTKKVAPILWSLVSRVGGLEDLLLVESLEGSEPAPKAGRLAAIEPSDICFLQFTSGSTAAPKGVVVTHKSLSANGQAIMHAGLSSHRSRDIGITWLPLYHDMGLIGFVTSPLFNQVPVVFIPTLLFVKRPSVWMEVVHKYRGTMTFGPNFAFGLAAKRAPREANKSLDLSCLRIVGCGAEPINAKTMTAFISAFQPHGLDPQAVMPCYGMAEATLAIAFDSWSRPLKTVVIDRAAYEQDSLAKPIPAPSADDDSALEIVSCGKTFPGHEIGIMRQDGTLLPEGQVGEIVFRGPSMTDGYYHNPEATRELIRDGWLHSGDLGFMIDGDLYISGRQKDLIILNGRNYYPQAIEWAVEQVAGIRRGNVVAFSLNGETTERLVVVAETTIDDRAALADRVKEAVKETLGVVVSEVSLVPRGVIPKTSSGKLQRRKTKSQFEDGSLGREGNRTLGSTATRVALFRHITVSVFARIRHRIRTLPARMFPGAAVRRASNEQNESRS